MGLTRTWCCPDRAAAPAPSTSRLRRPRRCVGGRPLRPGCGRRWRRSRPSTSSCWLGGRWPEWPWWPRRWQWWPTWRLRRWRREVRGAEKITFGHRERSALIYVRQSSLAQVRDNTESTARQDGLVEEAVRLGWARSAVEVIDADLGLSGRSAEHRSGYKDLVGRVCLGEVDADGIYDLANFNDRLVRHEVLCDRVEVKRLHRQAVAAA